MLLRAPAVLGIQFGFSTTLKESSFYVHRHESNVSNVESARPFPFRHLDHCRVSNHATSEAPRGFPRRARNSCLGREFAIFLRRRVGNEKQHAVCVHTSIEHRGTSSTEVQGAEEELEENVIKILRPNVSAQELKANKYAVYKLPEGVDPSLLVGFKGTVANDLTLHSGARCYVDFVHMQVKVWGSPQSIDAAMQFIDKQVLRLVAKQSHASGLSSYPREDHHVFSEEFSPTGKVKFVESPQLRFRKVLVELQPVLEASAARDDAVGREWLGASSSNPSHPEGSTVRKQLLPPGEHRVGGQLQLNPSHRFHDNRFKNALIQKLANAAESVQDEDGPFLYDEVKIRLGLGTELFYLHDRDRDMQPPLAGRCLDFSEVHFFETGTAHGLKSQFSNALSEDVAKKLQERLLSPQFGFKVVDQRREVALYARDKKDSTGMGIAFRIRNEASEAPEQYLEVERIKSYNLRPFNLVFLRPPGQLDARIRLLVQFHIREEASLANRQLWEIARSSTWSPKKRAHVNLPFGSSRRIAVNHVRYKEVLKLEGTVPLAEFGDPTKSIAMSAESKLSGKNLSGPGSAQQGSDTCLITVALSKVEEKSGCYWEMHCSSPSLHSEGSARLTNRVREIAALVKFGEELYKGLPVNSV